MPVDETAQLTCLSVETQLLASNVSCKQHNLISTWTKNLTSVWLRARGKLVHGWRPLPTEASPLALPPRRRSHMCASLSHTPGSSLFFISRSLPVFLFAPCCWRAWAPPVIKPSGGLSACLSALSVYLLPRRKRQLFEKLFPGLSLCSSAIVRWQLWRLVEARCYFTCATILPV